MMVVVRRQGGCRKRVGDHYELGRVGFAVEKGKPAFRKSEMANEFSGERSFSNVSSEKRQEPSDECDWYAAEDIADGFSARAGPDGEPNGKAGESNGVSSPAPSDL
jgi:hypothetical protein